MDPLLHERMIQTVQRQRLMGLGWRYDGLGDWTTEALFAKLHELGIDTDRARFADQAKQAGRCSVLREEWIQGKERYDLWDDFPFMASEELWCRLTPDLLCPEIVSRSLDEALRASEKGDQPRRNSERHPILPSAMQLMDYLESFPQNERAARYQETCACSLYDYGDVLLDAIMNEGGQLPDEATRIADVLSQTDPDRAASFQGDLPFALLHAGRREQALARIQANLARFPDDVWIRVHAGDIYAELGEDESALECYISALKATSDSYDRNAFRDRATEVLQRLGRTEDWENLQRDAPRPATQAPEPWKDRMLVSPPLKSAPPAPLASPAPSPKSHKIGVNEPCPCGSGKKYKKCCKR